MDTLAQRLQQTREEAHLSQTELAERAGCSQGLIGNLESTNQKTFDALASLPEEEAELWVSRVLTAAAEHRAEVARAKRQRETQAAETPPAKDRRAG